MIPSGRVPVGSNGRTTGGSVLGGRGGRALRASEVDTVSADGGAVSSRKYSLTTLTPVTDPGSTSRMPGDWFPHRSIRSVIIPSGDWGGMPLKYVSPLTGGALND